MSLVATPAIVLSALRYSETSKIVRLATRELGVQSAIAKGALRPRSRFGAALQLLSEGQAQLLVKEHRELHTLAEFDLTRLHAGLTNDLARYATASALAEVMLRFAPADPHPESYDLLHDALGLLEHAPGDDARATWIPSPLAARERPGISRRRSTRACATVPWCLPTGAFRSAPARVARSAPLALRNTGRLSCHRKPGGT